MPLPAKAKTYTHTANTRIVYASLLDTSQKLLLGLKNLLKTMTGVTVKGSSNSVAAAMDGTDRLAVSTDWVRGANVTTACSWIVFDTGSGMGNVEICVAFIGAADQQARVAFAPANDYALAATVTHQPTCTNEQVVMSGEIHPATPSLDRVYSYAHANDGSTFHWIVARNGVILNGLVIQYISSQVVAPATHTAAVWGWAFSAAAPARATLNAGTAAGITRITSTAAAPTGVNITTIYWSVEMVNSGAGPAQITGVSDLQSAGTGYLLYPIGLWSNTVNARGKIGALYDIYFGHDVAVDGDTYSDDGGTTKPWINIGDIVIPWNDSNPVVS